MQPSLLRHALPAVLALTFTTLAHAQAPWSEVEARREQGYSVTNITPIFGQLVAHAFPKGFNVVHSQTRGPSYIQEAVPLGESVQKWTQMITITGIQGVAGKAEFTPQIFAARIASGFKAACPNSFAVQGLGNIKIDGFDAFAAVTGCGSLAPAGEAYSEMALLVTIKGESDYYSLQWALRDKASATPPAIDAAAWTARLRQLMPIRLCPIVPGEAAPYPSCVARGK